MADLIDRQAAIEAIERELSLVERPITVTIWFDFGLRKAQDILSKLPSAEPTQKKYSNSLDALDCVSRQAAIEAIRASTKKYTGFMKMEMYTDDDAVEAIINLPSVEPKTARWVNVNEGKWNTVEVLKCTACGEIDSRMYRTDGYCPNCGAKMEGAEDGTD